MTTPAGTSSFADKHGQLSDLPLFAGLSEADMMALYVQPSQEPTSF